MVLEKTLESPLDCKEIQPVLLGAGTPPVGKVMRKEAQHMQMWDRASEVPLDSLKHLPPKPESAYFLLSPTPLTLWGVVLSLEKS